MFDAVVNTFARVTDTSFATRLLLLYVAMVVEGGDSLIENVAAVFGDDDSEMDEFDLDSLSDSLDKPEKDRDLISSIII